MSYTSARITRLQEKPKFWRQAITVFNEVTGDTAVRAVAVLKKQLKNRNRQIKDLRREMYRLEMVNWGLRTELLKHSPSNPAEECLFFATKQADREIAERLNASSEE